MTNREPRSPWCLLAVGLASALLVVACGGSSTPADSGTDVPAGDVPAGDTPTDTPADRPTDVPPADLPPTNCVTDWATGNRSQFVLNDLILPTADTATQFGFDLNGDGTPDNALGGLLAMILPLIPSDGGSSDPQGLVREAIRNGELLMGFQLWNNDLANDPQTVMGSFQLVDADADPTNNLTGSGRFNFPTADGGTVPQARLCGAVTAGAGLWGPGELSLAIPDLPGIGTITLRMTGVRMRAAVAATGLGTTAAPGAIGGGVTMSYLRTDLYPLLATWATGEIGADPCTGACTFLRTLDADGNGTITAAEVETMLGAFLTPDVTINGEPAISLGIGISAVGAQIAGAPER